MRTIINNPCNLKEDEMDVVTNKVRAIIVNGFNEIIVIKYADIYMLPGGKGEDDLSLIRELKEELGIDFSNEEIIPFIEYKDYIKDYPLVDSGKVANKLNDTLYYIIKTDKKVDINSQLLTEREKNNDFQVMSFYLDTAINEISNHLSINSRNDYFKKEAVKVLKIFNKHK